jgi:hypothetical protein
MGATEGTEDGLVATEFLVEDGLGGEGEAAAGAAAVAGDGADGSEVSKMASRPLAVHRF